MEAWIERAWEILGEPGVPLAWLERAGEIIHEQSV